MDIDLEGQSVTQVDCDYTVSVHTDGGYEIQIESSFSFRTRDQEAVITPGESDQSADYANSLFRRKIARAEFSDTGTLCIAFVDGGELRVNPDDTYEAWTVTGPAGYKAVCMPSGEVAVWSASGDENRDNG